jgi:hypothetical protein
MAREYSIPMTNATLGGSVTLIWLQVMTSSPVVSVEMLRAAASQSSSTTSNQQRVQINTQVSTFPTLTSQTPVRLKASDPVSLISGGTAGAAGTSGVNASAEGAGAKTVILPDVFNILNGWLWTSTPRETIVESPQATPHGLGIFFPATPPQATGWNAYITYAELG